MVDPASAVLMVYRWAEAGYTLALTARREEHVFAEPFEAVELHVGLLFGDDPEWKASDHVAPGGTQARAT